jgi:two-component system, NarL family, nitrate/nitrite response regulator NarL
MQQTEQDPIRVLVLADQGLGTQTLQRLSEAQSADLRLVGSASSLTDTLGLIASSRPQVIVIDIDGDYGPDTIAELADRCDARLLALTASPDTQLQDGAVLAGARGVVLKREAADTLVQAVRRVSEGDMWINYAAADRILDELAHARKAAEQQQRDRVRLAQLTPRERIIAREITLGHAATPKEIAARLQITEDTLQVSLAAIQRKLELADGEVPMPETQPGTATGRSAVVRFDRVESRSKPALGEELDPTAVACFLVGATADGEMPRRGARPCDPIVLPSRAACAAPIRVCRWRRLRQTN